MAIFEKAMPDGNDVGDGRVLVEFYAPRCSFCRAAEPMLERLKSEYRDVEFYKVNTDLWGGAAIEHKIKSLPTFVLFEDGFEKGRLVGAGKESARRTLLGGTR